MKHLRVIALSLALCLCSLLLTGCKKGVKPNFTSINMICELATLECYYHNVAKYEKDADHNFIIRIGDKKVWIEYSGIVKIGIDASKVTISDPDNNGVVMVTMPKAKVLSVDFDVESINEELISNGTFASITTEDKTEAIAMAQKNMEATAKENTVLLHQGQQRAKSVIEKFIQNVGAQIGKTYTVKWQEVD